MPGSRNNKELSSRECRYKARGGFSRDNAHPETHRSGKEEVGESGQPQEGSIKSTMDGSV